ncbi:MAG: hypothetical protein A2Y03_08790 [Omnitrophica WOR_2 bacterium GWF2_38_59]|nr:MAG: hypothetical protein A2Y03_08790 [Omnitrophica WOR_2 bacterium GWF2_38_59]OGX46719.1 MAG: hypothetical protein A2243_02420 [Omnitrophica WOR_2 bacterium RIFOXYA2_FULL_38_17]OGX53199.1 MAG: hypothetical protein A2267_06400 [Omnitrophica WOR_2 bacterium RIFOXYA12_FULL_38_10]OGX56590.1 MAG: hypothetical protein A2447_07095 [Omnitrophica WOR_2 bacterium RIFOXYC2_FULL_38_12]OGX59809.1 MAG: hypothetical protein A2306_05945 [Omnitrophica WOR_2 bacterium RIFOXYB2_FULL_38_16]HBG62132.1 hypothet
MNPNDLTIKFQRAMARNGLYGTYFLFKWLPFWFINGISNTMIQIGYILTKRHRNIARDSLNIAFEGQKSGKEIEQIVRKCFKNLGQSMIEMLFMMAHPDKLDDKVFVEGKHHLDNALKKGRGVVAVTAHFGNFPMMMLYFAQKGYDVSTIVRPARDKELEEFLYKKRGELNVKTVYALPRQKCVTKSISTLRNNGVLFVPLDQNFGNGAGVYVDFFGQKAATATGPVVFALRTKAVILPMFIIRQPDDRHKIVIEPPVEVDAGINENEDKTIVDNISKITQLIESYIRKYPYEWGWMHRRWKSRPKK